MDPRRFSIFAGKVIVAHSVTYFVAGAVAYQFLTRQFYEGASPLFASFMRTPGEPALWNGNYIRDRPTIWWYYETILIGGHRNA